MALTGTSLAQAITATQLLIPITNTALSGFPAVGALFVNQPVLIDSEMMWMTGVPAVGFITVRMRGAEGTSPVAHDVLANVYTSPTVADFPLTAPGSPTLIDPAADTVISVGQDGVLPVMLSNSVVNINKGSAAALTLLAPSLALNGLSVVFTSQTQFAHVITATALFRDGTSTSPKTTATFAGFTGGGFEVIAENGFWNVVPGAQNVTFT